jgi:AAA15 family ATPase/GTPase
MLKKVKIENYKSVVDQTLNLGMFNVIIGANGCGKSNLLEAIAMAGLSCSGALLPEMFESRGIRLSDNRFMRSAFEGIDQEFISVGVETSDGDESVYKIHYNTEMKPAQWEDEKEGLPIGNSCRLQYVSSLGSIVRRSPVLVEDFLNGFGIE